MNSQERDQGGVLLDLRDLMTRIPIEGGGVVSAVKGVSFRVARGESLALVRERA